MPGNVKFLVLSIALALSAMGSHVLALNNGSNQALVNSLDKRPEICQIRFGWNTWTPLQHRNQSGQLTGIQIDLVNAIARRLNCEVIFVERNWTDTLADIRAGNIDFTGNATITEDRKGFAYFSHPYRRDTFSIFVKSKNVSNVTAASVTGLKKSGFRLGLIKNAIYSDEIQAWQHDPLHSRNLIYELGPEANIEHLIKGEIDGLIDDPFVVSYNKRMGDFPHDIARLPFQTFGQKVSFMFSKNTISREFVERFNLALNEVKNLPEFQSIWLEPTVLE